MSFCFAHIKPNLSLPWTPGFIFDDYYDEIQRNSLHFPGYNRTNPNRSNFTLGSRVKSHDDLRVEEPSWLKDLLDDYDY